ncbi:MAG: pyruvate dehydrogenase complex dihydrolipoamide acetyltransferase [Rickettsiaceae bacterium]|nr:pyruvate dehydrogenase complex dihydrolipoamide acetyltransferase [Rickettsiaceae bacterium]
MIIEVLMPALSPTMTEGNLAKWLKKEGDKIRAGDVIAEIETDKATMEVEAVDEGILGKILISEGSNGVEVNSVIAIIIESESEKDALNNYQIKGKDTKSEGGAPIAEKDKVTSGNLAQNISTDAIESFAANNTKIFASPLAKRIASQNNINLENIQGTGPKGRIIKADLLDLENKPVKEGSSAQTPMYSSNNGYDLIPMSNMRKVIAKRLLESKITIPHFYLNIECNLDKLLEYRTSINQILEAEKKVSVNDFVIKAVARALRKVPEANVSWSNEGIMQYRDIDISVAVAIEGGLMTPIIKSANFKSLTEISAEMKELAQKARSGKLKPEEYQGGGFSISNLGMFGIKQFSAIINPPQSCILAVGTGIKKPVVTEADEIKISTIAEMTLSIDHRVIDGAVGARFLSYFKEYMENPIKMFI